MGQKLGSGGGDDDYGTNRWGWIAQGRREITETRPRLVRMSIFDEGRGKVVNSTSRVGPETNEAGVQFKERGEGGGC